MAASSPDGRLGSCALGRRAHDTRDRDRGPGQDLRRHRAVDGIDLAVRAGTVYGVLGPNGAGKTTTIRMLATLLHPDAGSAACSATTSWPRRRRAGPGEPDRPVRVGGRGADRAREPACCSAGCWASPGAPAGERADELLDAFGLTEAADRLVSTYSGGMRRRLDIAASIVVTPDLLFLDEPTTGLDPRSRNQVWEIVRVLVARAPPCC